MSTWITQFSWVRLVIIALVGTLLGVGIYVSPAYFIKKDESPPPAHLKASGTSVVHIIMENSWRRQYREKNKIDVDYASIGTSKGIEEMTDKKVPVAFLHAPMSAEERSKAMEKGGEVVHVPIIVCAVVPIFNLPELLPELQDTMDAGYDLRLMSPTTDPATLPKEGKRLIVVAAVNNVLHFRIFDGDGKMVVDIDETQRKQKAAQIEELRMQLQDLWPPHELTPKEKEKLITAVGSIKAKQLIFSGEVLAEIYQGKITKWNDERLKKLQEKGPYPELANQLPDRIIYVVHREDSSGTTLIFTEFLSQASKDFGKAGSKIEWPVGVPMSRNNGVADCVKKTKGAIGYVDLVNIWHDELPGGNLQYGAVLNRQGKPIHANAKNMTAAIEQALPRLTDAPDFQLTYQDGENSYPITGLIWAVCYQAQPEADRKKVADFLQWLTHNGQETAGKMSYAPLPPKLVERADEKIQSLKATP